MSNKLNLIPTPMTVLLECIKNTPGVHFGDLQLYGFDLQLINRAERQGKIECEDTGHCYYNHK